MNCREYEKAIPVFLKDDLKGRKLEEFLRHMEECENCREELTIQFLVSEGLQRLETGKSFAIQDVLNRKIFLGKKRVRNKKNIFKGILIGEIIFAILMIGVIFVLL